MKLDREEREAVSKTLSVLPQGHPARVAFEQGADPIMLSSLVEREEVFEHLEDIWLSAYVRLVRRRSMASR